MEDGGWATLTVAFAGTLSFNLMRIMSRSCSQIVTEVHVWSAFFAPFLTCAKLDQETNYIFQCFNEITGVFSNDQRPTATIFFFVFVENA